jgi:hypothetical protein
VRNSLHECMASGEPIIESEAFDPMQEGKHTAVHHLRRTSASGQPESGLSKSHGRVGRRGGGELRVSPPGARSAVALRCVSCVAGRV